VSSKPTLKGKNRKRSGREETAGAYIVTFFRGSPTFLKVLQIAIKALTLSREDPLNGINSEKEKASLDILPLLAIFTVYI